MKNLGFLPLPALYPIANLDSLSEPLSYINRLLSVAPGVLQVRSKTHSLGQIRELALKTIELRDAEFARSGNFTRIIINDHPEICLETGADGVHIGQSDCTAMESREIIGPDKLLGLSTHSLAQVESAQRQPVDYLGFGPIYQSKTKSGHAEIVGLSGLKEAASISSVPIVAIGGITLANLSQIYGAGSLGVSAAVISDLAQAADIEKQMAAYRRTYSA